MHGHYIFTSATGKRVLEVKEFEGRYYDTPAEKAIRYARKLQRKIRKPVIAWVRVGK